MAARRSRYQLIPVIIGGLQTNSRKPITSTYPVIASRLSPQTLAPETFYQSEEEAAVLRAAKRAVFKGCSLISFNQTETVWLSLI